MRFLGLLLAFVTCAFGAAPDVKLTANKPQSKLGELVVVSASTEAKTVKWLVVGEAQFEKDSSGRKLYVVLVGKATVYAVAASETGELSEFATLELGGVDVPPVKPGEPPTPIPFSDKFYFVVIREDGPVDPAVAQALRLPEWDELRKAGHQMKDYPAKSLPVGLKAPATLPTLITLRISEDGKKSRIVGEPQPLPTTADAVRNLLK